MRELVTAHDVARSVNVLSRRSQSIVNLDAFLRVVHTGFPEIESLQIRPSARRDEQHLASDFLRTCGDHDSFSIFARNRGTPPHKTDPFKFKHLLQQLANVRILFGEQAFCDDGDLATEPLISLRNLNADRATSDSDHRPGQPLVVEDVLVSKIGNAIEAVDCGNIWPRARCDQKMIRPYGLVAGQDRHSVDEPRGSEVNVHSFFPQLFRSGGFVDLLNSSVVILLHFGHVFYRRLSHIAVLRTGAYERRTLA